MTDIGQNIRYGIEWIKEFFGGYLGVSITGMLT